MELSTNGHVTERQGELDAWCGRKSAKSHGSVAHPAYRPAMALSPPLHVTMPRDNQHETAFSSRLLRGNGRAIPLAHMHPSPRAFFSPLVTAWRAKSALHRAVGKFRSHFREGACSTREAGEPV